MAHAAGTPIRIQRLTALVAICAVAIAVGFAFGRILQGHGATYRMLAVGLVSGGIAWATERRGMLVATLASAIGLILIATWLAAAPTAWYGLPTGETLRTLGTLATQVGGQAREYVSPAPMTPALILAGTIAVWAAVFSCYALAFRAQSPLLGLVPPLALVVFADSVLEELVRPLYGVLFLFAALAVLFADSLRRLQGWGPIWSPTGNRDRLLPIAGRNARRVGLTVVALALLAPVFMPGFGEQAVFSLSSINSDHRVRLSPLVQMSAVLTGKNSDAELFSITSPEPSYWRMLTLDLSIDPTAPTTSWQPPSPDDGIALTSGQPIPDATAAGNEITQSVTVLQDGGFSWLVAASSPTSISIDHDVSWHPASSSLQMDGWPNAGESYTVTSQRTDPSAGDLRLVGVSAEQAQMTYVPAIPPVIQRTAQDWTRGLTTDYDKVQAIRQRLSTFQYDTGVSYGDDPASLADMLVNTKRGFCQQFASLMAIMLRSIGIPARVALGFTSGTPSRTTDGKTAYIVHEKNYHAWVEVPFQGYGWLPFDPTPGFAGDPSAAYVAGGKKDVACPAPSRGCDGTATPPGGKGGGTHNVKGGSLNAQDTGAVARDLGTVGTPARDVSVGGIVLIALLLGLLVAIAIPLLRAVRRRRRLRAAREPRDLILATYDVFAERAAELGWPRAGGETPREYRARLQAVEDLGEDDRRRLERMTGAVVSAAYAPGEPDANTSRETAEDARAVLNALRTATPWKQRVLGLYRWE